MRLFLALLLLLPFGLNAATTFTEFYCDSTVGTNINSGSTTNAAATYTSVNGNFNGSTTFTPTDGSTPASTVNIGDWAAIYVDGATNLVQASSGGYIVRVLGVAAGANGAITVSTTAFAGTAPSSSATGRSIKVGGAWNGPYAAIGFPFGFLATTATNAANVFPRCNFKSTSQYNVTTAITHANAGPIRFQGMTLTAGDLGKATIDGGTSGSYYVLLAISGANTDLADLVFANAGASSTAQNGVSITGARCIVARCVAHDFSLSGFSQGSQPGLFIECEAFSCNKANTVGHGGFLNQIGNTIYLRCVSRDNTGSNASGYHMLAGGWLVKCISDSNGKSGVLAQSSSGTPINLIGCDFYNNSASGFDAANTAVMSVFAENCNFVKNGAYGITSSGSSLRNGFLFNCGFGTGTMTNTSGSIAANIGGIDEIGSVLYPADQTPWTDPGNGDFRINLTAAKAAGRGLFTLYTTNSPTVAFPDIGAAQSASTNAAAAGGTTAHTFAQ